ncbi:hypothetical protein AAVH_17565 [Aphelenchoides avenae]|nr:hypothetical protein AAVH_17565 [Aphelenchus avenae]
MTLKNPFAKGSTKINDAWNSTRKALENARTVGERATSFRHKQANRTRSISLPDKFSFKRRQSIAQMSTPRQ